MFSFNSWMMPGTILQGDRPTDVARGDFAHLGELEQLLERLYATRRTRDTGVPEAVVAGYFTYEGEYRFALFESVSSLPETGFSKLWQRRKKRAQDELMGPEAEVAWKPGMERAAYERMVIRAQEYIAAGDVYQVNLAQRFTTAFTGNPYDLFEHQLGRSPAPGGAFFDCADLQVLSASPELFLKIQGRHMITRPIKGTRPRSRDPVVDEQNAFELITDPKEQAELVMITDLERNDLGRVCEYGTVRVSQLLQLERFAHVFHLVSTVEGEMRRGVTPLEAVVACLPGGSISGAPKRRACEIIQELEPVKRGIYTGVIGYFDANGDAAFSIAIRTMILEAGLLSLSVGAGITADSRPACEYEETLAKAQGGWLAAESYRRAIAEKLRGI